MILKYCETFDYMKNQLLRDNDNISMWYGFEARNPLLSRFSLGKEPDQRVFLKKNLLKYGLKLQKRKTGFTLDHFNGNTEKKIAKLINLNDKVGLFDEGSLLSLVKFCQKSKPLIDKIFSLLLWCDGNSKIIKTDIFYQFK